MATIPGIRLGKAGRQLGVLSHGMCGIAGYLGPTLDQLPQMGSSLGEAMVHRGPDDEGQDLLRLPGEESRSLLLVHRRLSIIDTSSAGRQPMAEPDTGNRIVYNGEIYNFQDLRIGLEQAGVRFRSRTDTEVLLKGYGTRGLKILDALYGMYAFALWDARRRELVLTVDPMGIKPLYYWIGPGGAFLFASELRALLRSGLVPRRLDPVGLEGFLAYGAVQAPQTIVEDVQALLPGTYLVVSADGTVNGPHSYWALPFQPEEEATAILADLPDRLAELLHEVVGQHLISDVPLGTFLSGGIDSSALAALAKRHTSRLRTFSVTFAEAEYSEAPYSRAMAERHGFDHTELCLSEADLLPKMPAALDAMDQPTIDGTNVFVISQAVRQAGLTVALSGQGGDEVFAGYSTFRLAPLAARCRKRLGLIPPFAWRALGRIWDTLRTNHRVLPDKFGQFLSGRGDLCDAYFLLRQLYPPAVRRELFPAMDKGDGPDGLAIERSEALRNDCSGLHPINAVSLLEMKTYLANMLLRDGDVMSMAHGLEVRVPFLDRRLVEFLVRLSGSIKMERVLSKPLLVRAMGDQLPAAIYRRPKQGFTFPWSHWLRGELRPMAEAALSDERAFTSLGMEPRAVQALWGHFLQARPGLSWSRIWALVVLREWVMRNRVAA